MSAYNAIDKKLRRRFGFGAKENFSEMVRKTAGQNYIVKKYEDTLLSYARLRNAIVHGDTDEPIAEPHGDIVAKIENLCRMISAPPAALNKIAKRKVDFVRGETSLKEAVFLLSEKGHSHLPVIRDGKIMGIINGKLIVAVLADALRHGKDLERFLKVTPVASILRENPHRLFEVLGKRATIEDAAALFDKNKKLKLILITDTGTADGKILGVVTVADIVEFNNMLSE